MKKNLKIFFDVKAPDHRVGSIYLQYDLANWSSLQAVATLTNLYKKHPWLYENAAVCSFYPWLVYQVFI